MDWQKYEASVRDEIGVPERYISIGLVIYGSSYGNRNFALIYTSWFGSPRS